MLASLRSALALSVALLAACGSIPKSSVDTPTTFTAADTNSYLVGEPVVQEFWRSFDDPVLNSLVHRALLANRDLRATQARLRQSRALANQSMTDYLPGGSLSIQNTETRAGLAAVTSRYTGTAQAQWEIDLFGRITNGVMARSADARAALADLHAARVSVTSETARIYFQLRGANTRLSVARRSADNQRQSLNITQARFEEGAGSELDLQRARAQLQTTLATIPSLETQQQQLLNQLAVLLGEPAGQVAQPEILSVEAIALPELVPVGNPAEWLRRRPDIRRAEARLESTAAAARVSVASLFPRVSISGTATAAAADVGSLFEKANNTLLWGPTLSWAVLNIPRLLYDVAAQSARRDESLASYEHTVLTALAETESALSAYRFSRQRVAELEAAVTASERAEELSRIRYDAGAADFLSVLDAQRTQLQVADQLAQSRSDRAGALVAVYKALGVGWGLNDAAQALAR
ncbi:MAG: efflux transporter outer membrane subunit [Candidatus Obscuribacterales bacterium]|nr:efflux transporter outer membrane subunit [Steroidobacteraceae bacterium]